MIKLSDATIEILLTIYQRLPSLKKKVPNDWQYNISTSLKIVIGNIKVDARVF